MMRTEPIYVLIITVACFCELNHFSGTDCYTPECYSRVKLERLQC